MIFFLPSSASPPPSNYSKIDISHVTLKKVGVGRENRFPLFYISRMRKWVKLFVILICINFYRKLVNIVPIIFNYF